jgi:hypothetical protein
MALTRAIRPPLHRSLAEGVDSAAVGDSAISSTARRWVNSSGCRPTRGCSPGRIGARLPPSRAFLSPFLRVEL